MTNYGRLRRIRSSASSGVPLAEWRYNYDVAGNVTRAVDVPREASNWPTSGFTFSDTFGSKSTDNWTWSTYQTVPGG